MLFESMLRRFQHNWWFFSNVTLPMWQRMIYSILKSYWRFPHSWELLEQACDPAKGPLSTKFGFVPDPLLVEEADKKLPAIILDIIDQLPNWGSTGMTRQRLSEVIGLSCECLTGLTLLRAKQAIYVFAQCYIDAGRHLEHVLTGTVGQFIPPLPPSLFVEMQRLSRELDCFPACTSYDIFYLMRFKAEFLEKLRNGGSVFDIKWTDMDVLVRCLTGLRPGESEQDRSLREHVEVRFHTLACQMAYAASDIPGLVALAQKNISQAMEYKADLTAAVNTVAECVKKMAESSRRMTKVFEAFTVRDCPTGVWHLHIAKLTAGAYGFPGPSGPEFPTTMLLDILLGRTAYTSEVGQLVIAARAKLPSNHRTFVRAVDYGPNLKEFTRFVSGNPKCLALLTDAVNVLTKEHVDDGFLVSHRRKAYAYIDQGFKIGGPRSITGGTFYKPGESFPAKRINHELIEAIAERRV